MAMEEKFFLPSRARAREREFFKGGREFFKVLCFLKSFLKFLFI